MIMMMSNNELLDKYRELSNDYFIGIDDSNEFGVKIGKIDDKFSFVIRGKTNRTNFKSTSFVTIFLENLSHSEKQLIFVLENNNLIDVFLELFKDIYYTLDIQRGNSIEICYQRWCLWKELFSNTKKDVLTEFQIRGLLAELYFLNSYLKNKYGLKRAILSWGGSDYNKKDFEIEKIWYEIKSTLIGSGRIKISSLEQLESEKKGYLVITVFEKSTSQNTFSISLNSLVQEIINSIDEPQLVDIFFHKLNKQNYSFRKEYDNFNYNICENNFYLVDANFPKLTHANVPFGVIQCEYSLDQLILDKYKIHFEIEGNSND